MRVTWAADGGVWQLAFRLDPEDAITGSCADGQPLKLATNSFRVELPRTPYDIHPDLLALAAWTVVAPWTRRRIAFDRPISAGAGQGDPGGLGDRGRARRRDSRGPAAGWRSPTAAAPTRWRWRRCCPDAPFVHFQRVSHPRVPNRWTHYRSEVLAALAGRRTRVTVVRSDLEFTARRAPSRLPRAPRGGRGRAAAGRRAGPGGPGLRLRAGLALAGRRPLPAPIHPRQPDVVPARRVGPGCSPRPACTSCSRWAG